MTDWSELFTKEHMPALEQVKAYMDSPLWNRLHQVLTEEFKARPRLEYSGCAIPGWNIKYKKRGKSLCTVYPNPHIFQALVITNECNHAELDFIMESCCDKVRELYRNTKYFNGGKWLFIEVDQPSTLDDVLKLIEFRDK